ncbi:MAG: SMP-30/gluconolactonase/LRE family protein [Planctomycetota bacterium]|nr:SMP-30/gluconolactonase/LRE family protein [Planctomycetota bacterium]
MTATIQLYKLEDIKHIRAVDHPESIGIGPDGTPYTTGTGCQVYRIDLETNTAEQFATTEARCLGSAVDAAGNLYVAHIAGDVLKIAPDGRQSMYATAPGGGKFLCTNYPAFDRQGNMYLSDSGDWSHTVNGHIYKIPPGGGEAQLWYSEAVDTPNAIALDEDETHLYFVETFGNSIARIAINDDGSAGRFERVVHMPKHIPDGIAFDLAGRLWIACHRPDAIYTFDPQTRRLHLFAHDWAGEALRGPTDVAFAGEDRDILLAASLDNLVVHRFDNVGVRGLKLNHPIAG